MTTLLAPDFHYPLEQLQPLLSVFPDARIVQTHRDPVAVTASLCTMLAYVARSHTEHVDVHEIGHYWSARVEDLLRASVRDRSLIPDGHILDVQFHEFMNDEMATLKRIYAFIGEPLTDETLRAMKALMVANPRNKLGRIEYHLEDFGLNKSELRQSLRFYSERFAIPDE